MEIYLQNVRFQMVQRWACPINAFMLSLAFFSMLLILKKLIPEIALTGLLLEIGPTGQKEVRQAEGFDAQRGDLVFELAKVLICYGDKGADDEGDGHEVDDDEVDGDECDYDE